MSKAPLVPSQHRKGRFERTFQAFANRNYRLYFGGQTISTTGTWIQLVAENWLVLRLGGSGTALGVTNALQFTPLLLFGAYGGVIVDRFDKRTLLTITQSFAAAVAAMTGLLVITDQIQIWMVWIAAFVIGCVNTIDNPCRQALTMELVGPDDIANAVALNTTVATTARAVGPAIGGLLLATTGVAACFLINAASYLGVVTSLRLMEPSELHQESRAPSKRGQLREGLRYVRSQTSLRVVLLAIAVTSMFGFNFQILLALLATDTFHGEGSLYGLLMSVFGAGALSGSLIVASWSDPTVRRVGDLGLVFGLSLLALAGAPTLPLTFIAAAVLGVAFSLFLATCSGFLQVHTDAGFRGRVMALYTVAFLGTAPVGGPLLGWVAENANPRIGLLVGAIACLTVGAMVILRARGKQALDGTSR